MAQLVERVEVESARLGLVVVGEAIFSLRRSQPAPLKTKLSHWPLSHHVSMLEEGAEQRTRARVDLGLLYELGELVPQDLSQSLQLYSEADADADLDGTIHLALLYKNGLGTPIDEEKAVSLYDKAARQGHVIGKAVCMERGQGGFEEDPMAAIQLLEDHLSQGGNEFLVKYHLAFWLDVYPRQEEDRARAIQYTRELADLGSATSIYNLGVEYARGIHVDKDIAKTAVLYQRAVDKQYPSAMNNLATLYCNEKWLPHDFKKVIQLWERAVSLNYIAAFINLGGSLRSGDRGEQDPPRAIQLFHHAATHGHAAGQCGLGCMLQNGEGVPRPDAYQANYWFKRAAINIKDRAYKYAVTGLSVNLAIGKGIRRDWIKSIEWAFRIPQDIGPPTMNHLLHFPWDDDDLCTDTNFY